MIKVLKYIYFMIAFIIFIFIGYYALLSHQNNNFLTITSIDVGQGDSVLIKTKDGKIIIIDTGSDSSLTTYLLSHETIRNNTIDLLVITHPDKDHIGGLDDLLSVYNVSHIIVNYDGYLYIKDKNIQVPISIAGHKTKIQIEDNLTLDFLWPTLWQKIQNDNDQSLVVLMKYGYISALFMGDASQYVENYILNILNEEIDILKIGHHGSKYSSSWFFIDKINPKYAIISASKNNSYNHPSPNVVNELLAKKIKLLKTYEFGHETIKTDGKIIIQNNIIN